MSDRALHVLRRRRPVRHRAHRGRGGFDVVAERLDRQTSLELTRGSAHVVTYDGDVWRVDLP